MNIFVRYCSVGVINTIVHFVIFTVNIKVLGIKQFLSNLIAFLVAITFSYYANSIFTFQAEKNVRKYLLYISVMAVLSLTIGYLGDMYLLHPLLTFLVFSFSSLVIGFLLSKYLLYRD